MSKLAVRRLRLQGINRNYDVSFLGADDRPERLAVIAGQISTGKTSVLEFISYCLGGADFPHHPEVRSRVRSALLECELQGARFVIERSAVQQPSKSAFVHSCTIDELEEPHPQRELTISPPSDDQSLSQFLLGQFGIAHVVLREAPTQDASAVDKLSIRDVLRVMFVENSDLDSRNLLLERSQPVVRLKHEQVLDLMFWAHDNSAASLAAEVRALEQQIADRGRDLATIEAFMAEQRIPALEVIDEEIADLEEQEGALGARLSTVEARMDAEAAFGDEQRSVYQDAATRSRRLSNELRDIRTQLDRLLALGAQYEQDIKKLVFAKEASRLFDPLSIEVCPWCLQPVTSSGSDNDACFVCHQPIETGEDDVDLDKELRAIRSRHKELVGYLDELRATEDRVDAQLQSASEDQRHAQVAFDAAMRGRFSPFMTQRDALLEEITRVGASAAELSRTRNMHVSRQRRRQELGALRQQLAEVTAAQLAAAEANVTRGSILGDLTDRLAAILGEFRYPKLADVALDRRFVPSVRGVRYDQLGSAGAMTLIALAWYLALFEKSAEDGGAHPGLLMIDSPQKNLVPASGHVGDDYQAPAIARGVYQHLVAWAESGRSDGTQLIIVDNDPPDFADQYVVARYSGDSENPPYGLIEDAIE